MMRFEDEQFELLAKLIEAHRSVPPEKRGAFIATWPRGESQATFFHSLVNDLRFQGSMSDAKILAQSGLLSMSPGSRGNASFSVLPEGIEAYDQRKSSALPLAADSAGSGPRIFLSHSSRDIAVVEPFVKLLGSALNLRARDIRCTSVDGHRLPGGADTDEQLRAEIQAASACVGVISSVSLDSMYVTFELGARWGAGKHLVPVLAPGTPTSVLGGPLAGKNALRLENAAQIHQLVGELASVLEITPEPPEVYQSAIEDIVSLPPSGSKATSQRYTSIGGEPAGSGVTIPSKTIVVVPQPNPNSCWWHMGRSGDDPIMQVVGAYTVTNIVSFPVLLTVAKMKHPKLLGSVLTREVNGDLYGSYHIPAGSTTNASFDFWISPPIKQEGEVFSSGLALVDQFGNDHWLGDVEFVYQ